MNDQTTNPICCLCDRPCECPYGNNPSPLQPEKLVIEKEIRKGDRNWIFIKPVSNRDARCCNICNAEKVIPARIRQSCGTPSKEEFLKECKEIVKQQICEIGKEMSFDILGYADPYDLERKVLNVCISFIAEPQSKKLREIILNVFRQIEREADEVLALVMGYVQSRFERHLAIRVITTPDDVCRTAPVLITKLLKNYGEMLVLLKEMEDKFFPLVEEIRQSAEKLVSKVVLDVPTQTNKTELRRETEKERTKNANRKREQEKEQKKEQERQLAIANAKRLQQQQQRAREIAKKKKQATLNALQKIVV